MFNRDRFKYTAFTYSPRRPVCAQSRYLRRCTLCYLQLKRHSVSHPRAPHYEEEIPESLGERFLAVQQVAESRLVPGLADYVHFYAPH